MLSISTRAQKKKQLGILCEIQTTDMTGHIDHQSSTTPTREDVPENDLDMTGTGHFPGN